MKDDQGIQLWSSQIHTCWLKGTACASGGLLDNLLVLVESLCEYENVIQVDHHHTFHNKIFKDVIHHCLECGQTVGEAEEHNKWLEQATVCPEGSLPLITLLD